MKFDQKKIEEWKQEFGGVYHLTYDDAECLIRDPLNDLNVMKQATGAMMKGSVSSFTETILKNCFLAGDEKIKSEDHYINGLQNDIDEIATIPDHQIIREAGFVYIVVKDTKIRFREANRGDVKAAEKRNPGFRPFLSEEEILKRCAEDKTQIEDLKKSNPPVYLGFLTAADELKKKSFATIRKL